MEHRSNLTAKDPDASDPHNGVQRFGRGLYRLWQGLTGVNGIFALKYGIVSIALWIPQVIESSAYFTYTNRGLWALIMVSRIRIKLMFRRKRGWVFSLENRLDLLYCAW